MSTIPQWLRRRVPNILTEFQRSTHVHVIGQPRTGKTRGLESWIIQDIEMGHGVCAIDIHGDLFKRLLAYVASRQDLMDRVIILDPLDEKWTVCFNPLGKLPGISEARLSHFLADVVSKIWRIDTTNAPRTFWLITNSFLALSSLGLNLLDLPRFLFDSDFRKSKIPMLPDEAKAYFEYEYPKSPGAIQQWATPVLNKISNLIYDKDLQLILAGKSTINFREIIDKKLILLVNLPKGIIGETGSSLMAAFIVAYFQKAALSRADSDKRSPYYLYLDEFQNYTTDNIKDILSETRKYALALILAHQFLDQLSPVLKSAVLNTVGTTVSFRVGYGDASHLAKEIFPSPDFLSKDEWKLEIDHIGIAPYIRLERENSQLGWEGLAKELTKLRDREFWCSQKGVLSPVKLRTYDMPDSAIASELRAKIKQLRNVSGARYGRLKDNVRAELKKNQFLSGFKGGDSKSDSENGEIPLWGE